MSPCSSDDVVEAPAHARAANPTRPERTKMGTPFPWLPMMAISVCLVTVAYALCNLFPYVGYMVQDLGVTDDKDGAGFYAGYLSSSFMVGRFLGSYFWGRAADRYGRLPVMYTGLCSVAFLSIAFGLSTTFIWAFACRFLLGALNGLVATAKTMISEVCGSEHEVVGMSFVTGCWSVGLVLGSGLGGLLAEPADHYPTLFSKSGLFGRLPYLLPNIVGASLALIGLPLVFFFLEETLDVHRSGGRRGFEPIPASEAEFRSQEAQGNESGEGRTTCVDNAYDPEFASGGGGGGDGTTKHVTVGDAGGCSSSNTQTRCGHWLPLVEQRVRSTSGSRELEGGELRSFQAGGGESRGRGRKMAFLRECLLPVKLLQEHRVRSVLFVYVLFSLLDIGFDEAYPLWAISSGGSGGLDWTVQDVGQALAACGGGMLIFQLLVYPRIVNRIGPTRSQRWACFVVIPVFLAYPFLSQLHDSRRVLMAVSLALLFFTNIAANTVFINFSLAINNAVDASKRGTLNGLSMTLGSLATAAGPTVFSTIFAWSIDRRRPFPLDRHLIFCLFAVGMVVVTATSWNVVISPVEAQPEDYAASAVLVAQEVDEGIEMKGSNSGE